MPVPLADRITSLPESRLYDMLESGWSATVVAGEIKRRGLSPTRPKAKKAKSTGRGHKTLRAPRSCGVTGGYVDRDTITHLPRVPLPGQPLAPWHKYATN